MKKKTLFKGTKRDYNYAYNKALDDVLEIIKKYTFDKESKEWAFVRTWILKEQIHKLKEVKD